MNAPTRCRRVRRTRLTRTPVPMPSSTTVNGRTPVQTMSRAGDNASASTTPTNSPGVNADADAIRYYSEPTNAGANANGSTSARRQPTTHTISVPNTTNGRTPARMPTSRTMNTPVPAPNVDESNNQYANRYEYDTSASLLSCFFPSLPPLPPAPLLW
jgi:hypothetical protein